MLRGLWGFLSLGRCYLQLQNRYYIHINNGFPRAMSLKCIPWRFHKGTLRRFFFHFSADISNVHTQSFSVGESNFLLGAVLFCHAKDKETHLLLQIHNVQQICNVNGDEWEEWGVGWGLKMIMCVKYGSTAGPYVDLTGWGCVCRSVDFRMCAFAVCISCFMSSSWARVISHLV